jgi:hypothetical protein
MNGPADVDRALVEHGDRVFNSGPVTRTKARRGMTGLRVLGPATKQGGASKADAKAIRKALGAIVKRAPQVMVRISGGGKNIRHIKAHLDYISRNGQIPLEDQNGDQLSGKDDIDALRDEWQHGGFPIPEEGEVRQAFNIILSMPAGTDEHAVFLAARDFAESEFGNFQYAMALHTLDTDPDKSPSPNPHVHLCVKAVGLDGVRLNPRKDDLQRWREGFAQRLREHGVEASATRRVHRLQRARGEKQSVLYMKARGQSLHTIGRTPINAARKARAQQFELDMLSGFHKLATVLAKSDDPLDRKLAIGIIHRVSEREQHIGKTPDRSLERGAPEQAKD